MSQVRDLAGKHLGRTITITTDNTTAKGVLQGIEAIHNVIYSPQFGGHVDYDLGAATAAITLLPNQRIIAKLNDAVAIEEEA